MYILWITFEFLWITTILMWITHRNVLYVILIIEQFFVAVAGLIRVLSVFIVNLTIYAFEGSVNVQFVATN